MGNSPSHSLHFSIMLSCLLSSLVVFIMCFNSDMFISEEELVLIPPALVQKWSFPAWFSCTFKVFTVAGMLRLLNVARWDRKLKYCNYEMKVQVEMYYPSWWLAGKSRYVSSMESEILREVCIPCSIVYLFIGSEFCTIFRPPKQSHQLILCVGH